MRILRLLALALTIALLAGMPVQAQSPFGVGSAEPAIAASGSFSGFFGWINTHQQAFYRSLTASLRMMRADPWAMSGLLTLSFAYGVFHAAGPGHGKAVISSYVIANRVQLKRGVILSFLSALLQGLMAILVVTAAYFLLRGSGITMTSATHAMELISFGMVVIFGLWLLVRKIRALWKDGSGSPPVISHTQKGSRFEAVDTTGHVSIDGVCQSCGISHIAPAEKLNAHRFGAAEAWSVIIAVGLRPCSGAILVLSFALLNGLYLAAVLSVFAMCIGTAITVSILAVIAVMARNTASRFGGPGSRIAAAVTHAMEIVAALAVLLIGLSLLGAALQGPASII